MDKLIDMIQCSDIEMSKVLDRLAILENKIDSIRQLVGPFGVAMPDGSMLVQTLHGIKYLIDPTDLIMAPQLIIYRQWEAQLTEYFCSLFNSDTVFVDVGANFGYFTCLAGTKIGRGGNGSVTAVEPNPSLFKLLQANSAINWSMCEIAMHECAVGQATGEVHLWIPSDRAANASLSEIPGGKKVNVQIYSLDSILNRSRPVNLMKIDVEGHEAAVLRGASEVINRSPDIRIVIEWSQSQMLAANTTPDDMFYIFKDFGLVPFAIEKSLHGDFSPRRVSELELRSTQYSDVLLTRI